MVDHFGEVVEGDAEGCGAGAGCHDEEFGGWLYVFFSSWGIVSRYYLLFLKQL
jgi:hypothetical protein